MRAMLVLCVRPPKAARTQATPPPRLVNAQQLATIAAIILSTAALLFDASKQLAGVQLRQLLKSKSASECTQLLPGRL